MLVQNVLFFMISYVVENQGFSCNHFIVNCFNVVNFRFEFEFKSRAAQCMLRAQQVKFSILPRCLTSFVKVTLVIHPQIHFCCCQSDYFWFRSLGHILFFCMQIVDQSIRTQILECWAGLNPWVSSLQNSQEFVFWLIQ